VVTALRRRVPHIPVVISPAAVQGAQAAGEIVAALTRLYQAEVLGVPVDLILLVRGGGSIDDLWSFNDERLARTIVQSPVPLVCGVGHETDFTIADFCADLRAPTPTAAAELAAQPRDVWLGALDLAATRLDDATLAHIDRQGQRLDVAASRLGRPSGLVARQQLRLSQHAQQLRYGVRGGVQAQRKRLDDARQRLDAAMRNGVQAAAVRLDRARLRLDLLDPRLVLQRGYALLQDGDGKPVTRAAQTRVGQALRATLADGEVDLAVLPARLI